ncbi:MAG: hypothetical protein ACFB6S_13940 [Geminicoccaceae bacterium]
MFAHSDAMGFGQIAALVTVLALAGLMAVADPAPMIVAGATALFGGGLAWQLAVGHRRQPDMLRVLTAGAVTGALVDGVLWFLFPGLLRASAAALAVALGMLTAEAYIRLLNARRP